MKAPRKFACIIDRKRYDVETATLLAGDDYWDGHNMERHGRKTQVIVDRSDDVSVGKVLRRQIKALNADLLVMGLYGRSRLREMILGGVSRELLGEPPVPLLASH